MDIDSQHGLAEFSVSNSMFQKLLDAAKITLKYSKWGVETEGPLILDFQLILSLIPNWVSAYSNEKMGTIHRIVATMKVRGTQSQYNHFIGDLRKSLTDLQCHSLEKVYFILSMSCRLTVFLLLVHSIQNLSGLIVRRYRA